METKNTNDQDEIAVMSNTSDNFKFRTPAGIQDFQGDTAKQTAMNTLWSANLDGFTQQGMLNNAWNTTNTPSTTNYYNPVQQNPQSKIYPVLWSAFPGRLAFNFPSAPQKDLNEMADTGVMPALIKNNPCGNPTGTIPYFPYGPRGWQDEYCEWAVTRNEKNEIIRIDFTCENPEYWNSLWLVDPNKVLSLYQSTLNKAQITLDDLSLKGAVNPITGGPVYNPLNKWNTGTVSNPSSGGAMHLTSTPNTLQTEIGLATSATVQRNNPATGNTIWPSRSYNDLLCFAQYGQKNRNSDPTIGGTVNNLVNGVLTNKISKVATLADPPGLYIQMPDFRNYKTPEGTDASEFWRIVRGSKTLKDQYGNTMPGNFILHAVFEIPQGTRRYTISDITINNVPISWGSQIARTFQMQIVASAFDSSTEPKGYNAVGTPDPANTFAQPLQLFHQDYFYAMYDVKVPNPVNNPIPLLSNSTFIPPTVFNSANRLQMVLLCDTCTAIPGNPSTFPRVTFDDSNITAVVNSVKTNIEYAVPGNSMPGSYTALFITLNVGVNAAAGPHGIFITNVGQNLSKAMPATLVVAPTTIQANVKWQNTGVTVTPGTQVKIAYQSGLWTSNPGDNNGQLYNAYGTPHFRAVQPGYTMPGQNDGALIGRVGGTEFLVGMGATVPANLQGELQLCINDDLNGIYGVGFVDNIGSITVKITIG
nr:hypothetical protein [uncultured Flavobacterium sp.]